jgi:ABC-type nitrate/sulfonate/bicarbonate transport system permease component
VSTPEATQVPPRTVEAEPPAPPEAAVDAASTRTYRYRLSFRERLKKWLALRDRGLQLLLLLLALGIWEYVGRQSASFTFAPPSSVFPAAREMIGNGELPNAVTDSLVVLLLGFAAAAVTGVGLGYAMGWWRTVGRALDPFVAALYVVPIVTLVPLIVVWIGLGMTSRVLVIYLFALFEILFNAHAGVRNVDPEMIDAARTFGASRKQLLWKIVLPASLPFVFVGLRIGAIRALKGMVLAEMLFAVTGLGGLIIRYSAAFQMDRVLVVILTIVVVGVLLSTSVRAVEHRVMRWRYA